MKPGVYVEKRVTFRTEYGPMFVGSMDVFDSRPEIPVVYDIKTKSSFDYLLNSFQLVDDVQLAIYALWVMETKKVQQVKLVHIYVLRDEQRPEIKIVQTQVSREQVEQVWQGVLGVVEKMVEYAATVTKSLDVPGNEASCFAFGKPCYYLNQCEPESPLVGLRIKKPEAKEEIVAETDDSLLEQLRKKKAAAQGVVSAPTPVVTASILPPDAPPRTTPKPTLSAAGLNDYQDALVKKGMELVEEIKEKSKKAKEKKPEANTRAAAGKWIYVGCTPLGWQVPLFADWVRPIEEEVAAKNKVAHWNLVEYHAAGILFDAIRAKLDTLPNEVVLYGNEPAAGIFLSAVKGACVVKGF